MTQTDDRPDRDDKWVERNIDSSQGGSYSNGHSDTDSSAHRPDNLSGDQNDLYDQYRESHEDRQQDS
jgi:hypothetical protein